MRIRCPNCHHGLEIVADAPAESIRCPSCGSQLNPNSTETATYKPETGRMVGHFELLEHVGRGHFGNVWRARDTQLTRIVAVKIPRTSDLTASDKQLFLREAQTAAKLRHANIVTVHEVGYEGDDIFIVSDFIQGVPLSEQLKIRQPSFAEAASWCAAVADALDFAHEQGVIHRDIKPGNIMLEGDNKLFVLDFGLAKTEGADFTITTEGEILGTPAYMSPEQARGDSGSADRQSDVYSLGVVLYEMITGETPFKGGTRSLIHQILNQEPKSPRRLSRKVPRDLETICLKAMSKEPARRYQTAGDLASDLRRFIDGLPIKASRASVVERGWRWCMRNPAISVLSAIAGVSLSLLVVLQIGNRENWTNSPAEKHSDNSLPTILSGHQEPPSDAFQQTVIVVTEPTGSEVACYPLDWDTGRPDFARRKLGPTLSPTEMKLSSGMYLVVAHNKEGFHEVIRTVPRYSGEKFGPYPHQTWTTDSNGQTLQWPPIKLFPYQLANEDLVRSEGTRVFEIDLTPLVKGSTQWRLPPFLVESTELSVAKYQRFNSFRNVHRDRPPKLPAGDLTWDMANVYAEARGMRLPDLLELEFLSSQGGKHLHPWGDEPPPADNWDFDRPLDASTRDRLNTIPPISGLESGVLEWTLTRTHTGEGTDQRPGLRFIVRGGPTTCISPAISVGRWSSVNQYTSHPGLGLRCARSPGPRLKSEDFVTQLP